MNKETEREGAWSLAVIENTINRATINEEWITPIPYYKRLYLI
jgi:hypothetical protein